MAEWYVRGAWALLILSIIGWPLTQFTVAKDEPPFVLGLSWFAIVLTAVGILATTDVRREQDKDTDEIVNRTCPHCGCDPDAE
jgi:hypothetical protein